MGCPGIYADVEGPGNVNTKLIVRYDRWRDFELIGPENADMNKGDYQAKLEKAELELYEKKVGRKQSHPLLFKLMRALGVRVRLPHYSEPATVFVCTSLYFTALVAALLWFVQRKSSDVSVLSNATISIFFGVLFGLCMLYLNIHNRKKYQLTPWEEL